MPNADADVTLVSEPPRVGVTRLAPSPTGALHLGNARTFMVNWALARQRGWTVLMRIEDLDGPRIRAGAAADTLNTLAWLGLDWDGPALVQSDDLAPYRSAMQRLARAGVAYACDLTRAQIEHAASAPNEGSGESVFPASLRPAHAGSAAEFRDESTNWRLAVGDGPEPVRDAVHGELAIEPARTIGDFVVWTKRGVPAYQLAVVVDDHRQGVTEIVRGDDLLDSAARQQLVARALGLDFSPVWCHLPLVRGEDGRRLAKRHGDTRLIAYREAGVAPERVRGLLAYWSGVIEDRRPVSAGEFVQAFDLASMPRRDVVFTREDDAWLRA